MPADAYNTWQIWADYNDTVVERDLAYAAALDMNAVRVFASYEYWREEPDAFERRFDHFLATAEQHDIRVLPVLFESIGDSPTAGRLEDDSIRTAFPVRSPAWRYMALHTVLPRWAAAAVPDSPAQFTAWFVDRYGTDDRVLAVEIMNEPGHKPLHYRFADEMLVTARKTDPQAPLTMGSRELQFNTRYSTGLDVHQFHHNLPVDQADMADYLDRAAAYRAQHGAPVWLTEWQRTRFPPPDAADFPDGHPDYPQKMLPNYESLAPQLRTAVQDGRIDGAFLWGLMLQPAYICTPRTMGRINGLFHPDGAVYDLGDAQAVAGNDTLALAERQRLPPGMDWFLGRDPAYCNQLR